MGGRPVSQRETIGHAQTGESARSLRKKQPAGLRLRRKLSWFHPLIYLSLFLGLLIFVILAIVLQKRATIYMGLSQEWFRKRRRALPIGWMTALLGLAVLVGSIVIISNSNNYNWTGWGIPLGIVAILGGAIYGSMASQMVSPVRITDDYVWLKGVHPDYLADLPPWPNRP